MEDEALAAWVQACFRLDWYALGEFAQNDFAFQYADLLPGE